MTIYSSTTFRDAELCVLSNDNEFIWDTHSIINELYYLRRIDENEKRFWNQFWHSWNYPMLKEASKHAFRDIAADRSIKLNFVFNSPNFEKAVASDIFKFKQFIINTLYDS